MRRTILAILSVLPVLVPLLAVGCHRGERVRERRDDKFVEAVYTRAQFDMGCAQPGQIQIQPIGGQSYGVIGCGRRASYTCLCMYHAWYTCTQVVCQLNGPVMQDATPVGQPPPPAQPPPVQPPTPVAPPPAGR